MAYRPKLLILSFLVFGAISAHATYANLVPPPGWVAGTGSNATFAAATANQWINNAAKSSAMLNVGGRQIAVNASMRLAANAPRIAAAAIFLNPYVRTAVGIAAWLGLGNLIWDAVNNRWGRLDPNSGGITDGYTYSVRSIRSYNLHHGVTPSEACNKAASSDSLGFGVPVAGVAVGLICQISVNGQTPPNSYDIAKNPNPVTCTAGMFVDANGVCHNTPQTSPVTQKEFEDALEPKPMPSTVPNELPKPTPLPVEQPIINPSPALNPQPLRVPMGEPQPVPNTDPQEWRQPVIDIVPSPTLLEPWRVDIQPKDIIKLSPTPIAEPIPVPDPNTDPAPDKTEEKQPDLCEKNPDILACQKLDNVDPQDVQNVDKTISLTPTSGWGNESAACPAPIHMTIMGTAAEFSWQPICDFASGLRPLIIALAWLSAATMVITAARRSS